MDRQPRLLSYSEIETAMTCQARWDFRYGGRLAGSTLKRRELVPMLSGGRAWGAGVAAWHQGQGTLLASWAAHAALKASLDRDAAEMAERGFKPSLEARVDLEGELSAMLDHYMSTAEPIYGLSRLEAEMIVALPSRSGKRSSTLYRFQCFLDGFTDENGMEQLVEFKLRGRLTEPALLERQRQPRWYAWAYRKQTGRVPAGVIVDERLREVPKPAALTEKGRKPSHKKDQLTTPELYADLCHEFGELPKLDVMEHLRQRQWQQRYPLSFRPDELDEAGDELVSAAQLIRDLDNGTLHPVRNATRMHCNACDFKAICSHPQDTLFVDTEFERTVPKRLREPIKKEAVPA
jgi:hypothetical protein